MVFGSVGESVKFILNWFSLDEIVCINIFWNKVLLNFIKY